VVKISEERWTGTSTSGYASWVRARQEQLEADIRRTWVEDPIALAETKGTFEVHGGREAVTD